MSGTDSDDLSDDEKTVYNPIKKPESKAILTEEIKLRMEEKKKQDIEEERLTREMNENPMFIKICNLFFKKKRNIFLSGPGGVGKTYMMKYLKKEAIRREKIIQVTSTTGVSASNIGAITLHSFIGAGLADKPLEQVVKMLKKNKETIYRLQNTDIIFVDEISMCGAVFFEKCDNILRTIRKTRLPFGGIQLLVSGDFMQLKAVNDDFCFKTQTWQDLDFKIVRLTVPYRFRDKHFFDILQRIRYGMKDSKDILELKKRVAAHSEFKKTGLMLNSTYLVHIQALKKFPTDIENLIGIYLADPDIKPTTLFSMRKDVKRINKEEMDKLPGIEKKYRCDDIVTEKDKKTIVKADKSLDWFKNQIEPTVNSVVGFKVGAQVMLTKNIAPDLGHANGSRGIVVAVNEISVDVRFINGTILQLSKLAHTLESENFVFSRYQIPLIPCWSTTIHKIQGSTLDSAIMDLGNTVFEAGIVYVALSRLRSLDDFCISEFLPAKISAHEDALEFETEMLSQCQ